VSAGLAVRLIARYTFVESQLPFSGRSAMDEVTRILSAMEQGDPRAAEQLLPLVYDELRKLAASKLAHEKPGQTLQATALVHEAYLRLVTPAQSEANRGNDQAEPRWNGRGHFFAAAAEAIRRILVENARRKKSAKFGGDRKRIELGEVATVDGASPEDVLLLDDALSALTREDSAAAEVAKLRIFGGLSVEEAGEALAMSRATAFRHWTYARAWLNAQFQEHEAAR
jgi:RNA polymerase sigma factor (TIGR02999 family)